MPAGRNRFAFAQSNGMSDERLREYVELVRKARHDANGPLTVALGHVQLLLEDRDRLGEEVRESLIIVESELRRLILALRGLDRIRVDPPDGGAPGSGA